MVRTHLSCLAVLASSLCAQTKQEDFFGLDKIWDIHIEVTRDGWTQMFPKGARTATRMFGKFSYRTGDVTIGSHTVRNIGIRMKESPGSTLRYSETPVIQVHKRSPF